MQAAADVTKKECSWSSWKGQGTNCLLWFTLHVSVFCGCQRWTVISACRLNIHDTGISHLDCMYVSLACVHLSPDRICKRRRIKKTCLLASFSCGHTLLRDLFCLICVLQGKKKKRWSGWATSVGGRWMYNMLGAICFECVLRWMPMLWTSMCHCWYPPHCGTLQGSWFYAWHVLCFCITRQSVHLMVLADCLRGNQDTPILITSAPAPRPPWHLAETGAGRAHPASACFHQTNCSAKGSRQKMTRLHPHRSWFIICNPLRFG